MKLDSSTSIFNMGDTSIRVKQVVDVNKIILHQLHEFMKITENWEGNQVAQEEFYRSFIEEIVRIEEEDGIELFRDFSRLRNYTLPSNNKIGFRARTLTNTLVKVGLISSKRIISEVGKRYLNNELHPADEFERMLGLSLDNLVYLRQLLKLRIYEPNGQNYFYNFRLALKFLSKYDNVPQNDFLKIIESIKPNQTKDEINKIINDYKDVSDNLISFEDYYKNTFSTTLRTRVELEKVKEIFITKDFKDENFIKYFSNRDSNETSLLYKEFVLALIDLTENHSIAAFDEIKRLSRKPKIKKAFGANKLPFTFTRNESLKHFLKKNAENPLLDNNHYSIYLEFIFSKHNDLIREYSDMCRRIFQITGLISFDNGLANPTSKWILKPLLEILGDNFILNGCEEYNQYENTLSSLWLKDSTTYEILELSEDVLNELFKAVANEFGVKEISAIPGLIKERREGEYRSFIDSHFPKHIVIHILENIAQRNDDEVFKLVTDNATIPTIYEYILTIAWYHISDKKNYQLHESFQLSLDGNKLPLTHRGGGAGDIEIITDEYALLIEATLMNMNTQKRGELEPVIRHSTNFTLQHKKNIQQIQTIFIANELDNNVQNMFRATQFIELNGTIEVGNVSGLNIFALTTDEIILILNQDIKDITILTYINDYLDKSPIKVKNNWRIPIVNKILS